MPKQQIESIAQMTALELVAALDVDYRAARKSVGKRAPGQELRPFAVSVENIMRGMAEERERVMWKHPWIYGAIFFWLCSPSSELCEDGDKVMSRFSIMQQAGFWSDGTFVEWANEQTGCAETTWRNWMTAASRILFDDNIRNALCESSGVEPERLPDVVTMDKAVRAAPSLARGDMTALQVKALVDPSVSCGRFRHILHATDEEIEQESAACDAADADFVANGGGPRQKVEDDPCESVIRLVSVDGNGEVTRHVLARWAVPTNELVRHVQSVMAQAAKDEVGRMAAHRQFESVVAGKMSEVEA